MTSDAQRRTHDSNDAGNAGAESQVPTGSGEFSASLDVSMGAPRRRIGFGTLVLATTACVSALSLYTMRIVGTAGASDGTTEAGLLVESFLKERGGRASATGGRTDLLDPEASTRLQVPADELLRNPFASVASPGEVEPSVSADAPEVDPVVEALAIWNLNAESGIAEIRVQSVLASSSPTRSLANLNGRSYRIGDTIAATGVGMTYRVHAIERDRVVLEAFDAQLGQSRHFDVAVTGGK